MGILVWILWAMVGFAGLLVVLWIIGSFMGASDESKANAYLAKKYDEDRTKK